VKKLIFILFLFPFLLIAQVYKAGDVLAFYTDVTPDTLLSYSPPSGSSNESYYIDIDGDLVNDLRIWAYSGNGLGGGTDQITVNTLNPNTFVRFGRFDSILQIWPSSHWWITKVADPLLYGDSINSALAVWDNSYLTLTDNSYLAGAYKNVLDWLGPADKYIGIKYQNATDTIYGRIRVNCPNLGGYNNQCYVKDFSFESINVGIKEYDKYKSLKLYPNPTTNSLFISNGENKFQNTEIKILNYLGQIVSEKPYTNSVDVSGLAKGLYTLKIIARDNAVLYSKFVKE
jgi:hypothetical protein